MTDLKGRSSRKDFWIFYVINMIIILLLFTLTIVTTFSVRETQDVIIAQIMLLISFAYIGIIVLPLIAMTIRMLHDAGY